MLNMSNEIKVVSVLKFRFMASNATLNFLEIDKKKQVLYCQSRIPCFSASGKKIKFTVVWPPRPLLKVLFETFLKGPVFFSDGRVSILLI